MAESLRGRVVLIVEDEFYLADDLASALTNVGAKVLGPFGRAEEARRLLERGEPVDLAILDIGLAGDRVFPVADLLRARNAPFLFATGYDPEIVPEQFASAPRIEKPFTAATVIGLLEALQSASSR